MGKEPVPQGEEGSGDHAQPCRRAATAGTRGLRCPGTPLVPGGRCRGGCSPPRGRAVTALCCVAVHGAWEEWSPWSLCSVTCGRGARTRTRRCVAPRHGGKACEGPELQAKPCNIATCPGQYRSPPLPLLPPGLVPSPGTAGESHEPGSQGFAPGAGAAVAHGTGATAAVAPPQGPGTAQGHRGAMARAAPSCPYGEPAPLAEQGGLEPPPRAGGDSPGACWQLGWRGDVVGHREGLWGLCVRGWQRRHCFFILLAQSQPGGLFWGQRAVGASHVQPGEAGGGLGVRGAGEPLGSGCTHPAAAVAGPCPHGTGLLPCTLPARRAAARATEAPTAPSPPALAPTAALGLWGLVWSSSGGSQRVPWGLT